LRDSRAGRRWTGWRTAERGIEADDYLLYGKSSEYQRGSKQHVKLGDQGSHKREHRAGRIYLHVGEWLEERFSCDDDDLYVDGEE
jgi:hypothetical protein